MFEAFVLVCHLPTGECDLWVQDWTSQIDFCMSIIDSAVAEIGHSTMQLEVVEVGCRMEVDDG